MTKLQAPFPYFGGKSKVAAEVWQRFGSDVNTYIEPFCGSMAMLLHKDEPTKYETVNDIDGLLTNFWRAIKFAPEDVASLADVPASQLDLTARHNWVYARKKRIIEMQKDPEYYDVKAAAYWVYVRSTMIGGRGVFAGEIASRVPKLNFPQGIHAKSRRGDLLRLFSTLSKRLRGVAICCTNWDKTLGDAALKQAGTPTAVFLDPPYQKGEFDADVYEHDSNVFSEVREWCLDNGEDPDLRIALCGYEGNEMPKGWTEFSWKTGGGMGKISKGSSRAKENASRERIWFSPHCYDPMSNENTVFGSFLEEE